MPRSHAEAQAQRAEEILEADLPVLEEAVQRLALLVVQPGGEEFLDLFEKVKWELDAAMERRETMSAAMAAARELAARGVSKRASGARRASRKA